MTTYDLSHPIDSGTPAYPGDPSPDVEPAATVEEDGYRVSKLEIGTHTGTHIDAPAHVIDEGKPLDAFSLETFRFDTLLVDLGFLEPREPITWERLEATIESAGAEAVSTSGRPETVSTPERAADTDLILVRTGWEHHWGTERYHDHPYLTADAAREIIERGWSIGIDAWSVDPSPSPGANADEPSGLPAHHVLLENESFIVENLRGLSDLPTAFELHAYPLPVRNADGSPVRAVAVDG